MKKTSKYAKISSPDKKEDDQKTQPKIPPIIISELDPEQRNKIMEAIVLQRASIHSIGGGNYTTTVKLKIIATEPEAERYIQPNSLFIPCFLL